MYYTYVIENGKGKRYTGSTDNIDERLRTHNDESLEKAKFHRSTYKRGPWKLLFLFTLKTRQEALNFEMFLKTGKGRQWLQSAPAAAGNDEVRCSIPLMPT
jgi:putative endonuclease